jgi:hypothetical protein
MRAGDGGDCERWLFEPVMLFIQFTVSSKVVTRWFNARSLPDMSEWMANFL